MLNLGPRNHVGTEQLNTLGLLNVENRVKQIRLHNAHKVYHEQAPKYLMTNFNKSRNRQGMNTRHRAYNFYSFPFLFISLLPPLSFIFLIFRFLLVSFVLTLYLSFPPLLNDFSSLFTFLNIQFILCYQPFFCDYSSTHSSPLCLNV